MIWSCVVFSGLWVLIRILSEDVDPVLIVFYRSLFGLAALTPFFLRKRTDALRTRRIGFHLLRGFFALMATYSIFYAISVTPLADVTAISYAAPLFTAAGAVLFFGETVRVRRVTALVIGFGGVLMVLRPGIDALSVGQAIALFGAMMVAGSMLTIKALSQTEDAQTIVAYAFLLVLPASFVIALFNWVWPTWEQLAMLALLGFMANQGQTALTRAFAAADAGAILPFDFIRLVLAALFGYLLFNESLDWTTVVGAAAILASTAYVAHREARSAEAERIAAEREAAPRLPPAHTPPT